MWRASVSWEVRVARGAKGSMSSLWWCMVNIYIIKLVIKGGVGKVGDRYGWWVVGWCTTCGGNSQICMINF